MVTKSQPRPGVTRRPLSPDYTLEEIDKQKIIGRLMQPSFKLLKSKEGIEEYKKLGLQYPDNVYDKRYEDFLDRTPAVKGNDYAHKNKTRVTAITRHRLTPDKEYLVWNQIETRYTPLGNPETETRLNLGKYQIIEMSNVMIQEESGLKKVRQEPTGHTKIGYSLPYSVENIDNLQQNANDDYEYDEISGNEIRPTHYHVTDARKHMTIAIHNWEDFRDGDFDILYEYGKKIGSEQEAKAIKDKYEQQRQQVEAEKLDRLKRSVS